MRHAREQCSAAFGNDESLIVPLGLSATAVEFALHCESGKARA
jgi:hypothetical protein